MQIRVITKPIDILNIVDLDNFVLNTPSGNFFQSISIFELYSLINNYNPVLLIAEEKGTIYGSLLAVTQNENGFIKRNLSSRCIVNGGPVVKDNDIELTDRLLKAMVKEVAGKSIYIEFRNLFDLSKYQDVFSKNGFIFKEHFNFIVDIVNHEDNYKKLNANRRRQIKKSIKAGTEIVLAKEINEVKEFYLILKKLYKEKVKKPLPSFSFFEQFFKSSNLGKYLLVKYKGKIIGGIMCPIFKDTIYEWYICGMDKDYKNLYPSVLATWAPIEYAAKNGLKFFDFLGAGSGENDYGVREFKSKFGGDIVNYGRYIRINNKALYKLGKAGLKIYYHFK